MKNSNINASKRALIKALVLSTAFPSLAFAGTIADISRHQTYSLGNGVRVRLNRNNSGTIAGRIGINYGALYDPKPGTAHLLEHVIYGNTQAYSQARIRDLSARFADINAATDLEWITCTAGMLSDRLEEFLEFNSDAIFAPRFDADHVRREQISVLEEIAYNVEEIDPARRFLFGADHPLNAQVGGTATSIRSIDAADLREFHSKGFHPGLVSIVLAGELPSTTEMWIEKLFGHVEPGEVARRIISPPPMLSTQHRIDDESTDLAVGTSRVEISWNTGVTLEHDDFYSLAAVNHFLGADVYYSRLRQELGEKMPVAYSVESRYEPGTYASDFIVSASTTTTPETLVTLIFDVLQSMKREPVSDEIMPAFYDQWRYQKMVKMRTNEGLRDMMFEELKTGVSIGETELAYRNLTSADVQHAAQRHTPDRSGKYVLRITRGVAQPAQVTHNERTTAATLAGGNVGR